MQLTREDNIRIQQFLLDRGFIQDVADGIWNFHKSSGYRTYLETQPVSQADVNEVPHKIEMLTKELQEFLLIPSLISTSLDNEDSDNDESNSEETEDEISNEETLEDETTEDETTEESDETKDTTEGDSQSFSLGSAIKNLVKSKSKKESK